MLPLLIPGVVMSMMDTLDGTLLLLLAAVMAWFRLPGTRRRATNGVTLTVRLDAVGALVITMYIPA